MSKQVSTPLAVIVVVAIVLIVVLLAWHHYAAKGGPAATGTQKAKIQQMMQQKHGTGQASGPVQGQSGPAKGGYAQPGGQ